MTFLSRLFRGATTPEAKPNAAVKSGSARFEDRFASIPSIAFYGRYTDSPNKRWAICWMDADPNGHHGGFRESGPGAYVLYDRQAGRVVLRGQLERPNVGKVANTGIFVLNDWHFGEGLKGTFLAFSPDGSLIIKRKFQANLYNNGISPDGRWAACQTCNAPSSPDDNLFTVFSLSSGTEVFSVHPATGWVDQYEFAEDGSRFYARHKNLGRFAYDASGTFLEPEEFETARLERGEYAVAILAAGDLMKRVPGDSAAAQRALAAVLRARKEGADERDDWKAKALKIQGTALETVGRYDEAISAYMSALALNPKIGAKANLQRLKKQLAAFGSVSK